MLCKKYDLNPLTQICSHREGHSKGIASNHGDPEHLWNGLGMGLSMDGFRKAVKQAMKGETASSPTADTASTPASSSDEKKIWDYLYKKIGNAYGTAGLMGNLYSESGLRSNNMQNSFEKKLGFTDETYTKNVDKGTYSNFVKDGCGYGLAQWTFHTRKQALLDYAKKKGVSIGDLDMQLEFLWNELSGSYKGVLSALKAAKSVRAASDVVLTQFERPADQSDEVKVKRAGFGTTYYNRYAAPTSGKLPTVPFKARVTITDLNIREQPTTDSKVMGQTGAGVFTIVEVKSGKGSTQGWGKLKSGAGYISLDYITGV